MNRRTFLAMSIAAAAVPFTASAAEADTRVYEFRIYTAAPGKLDALNARFRDHTCKLFEKHGMVNIGYWVPIENADQKLYYVLAHASQDAAKASWKAFGSDPDWQAAAKASEADGKLVAKIESFYMKPTDFSPEVKPSQAAPRVFELRTYTTTPGNLPNLLARFRNHTTTLFAKHGMTNLFYWTLLPGQPAADDTLVYFLAHKDAAASKSNFEAFRADPIWVDAKAASEKAAGGSLTVPDGVKSILMTPTDYSPTK